MIKMKFIHQSTGSKIKISNIKSTTSKVEVDTMYSKLPTPSINSTMLQFKLLRGALMWSSENWIKSNQGPHSR